MGREVEKLKTTVSKCRSPREKKRLRLISETSKSLIENGLSAISPVCTPRRKDVAVSELEKALTEQAATITSLQKQNAELHQQNNSLSMELANVQKQFEQLKEQLKQATSDSLES